MRILILAALTACLGGAAWAGEKLTRASDVIRCERPYAAPDADGLRSEVAQSVQRMLEAVEGRALDAETAIEVEIALNEAVAEMEAELASLEERYEALSEEREAEIDARIEARLVEAEAAIERAAERIEDADAAAVSPAPKRWRPRY